VQTRVDDRIQGDPNMKFSRSPSHPDITEEMWEKIDDLILVHKSIPGAVITVLRECQDIVGYLPVELIDYISMGLNISRSEVFGIASFTPFFPWNPKADIPLKCVPERPVMLRVLKKLPLVSAMNTRLKKGVPLKTGVFPWKR
jgi:hypothetical protein